MSLTLQKCVCHKHVSAAQCERNHDPASIKAVTSLVLDAVLVADVVGLIHAYAYQQHVVSLRMRERHVKCFNPVSLLHTFLWLPRAALPPSDHLRCVAAGDGKIYALTARKHKLLALDWATKQWDLLDCGSFSEVQMMAVVGGSAYPCVVGWRSYSYYPTAWFLYDCATRQALWMGVHTHPLRQVVSSSSHCLYLVMRGSRQMEQWTWSDLDSLPSSPWPQQAVLPAATVDRLLQRKVCAPTPHPLQYLHMGGAGLMGEHAALDGYVYACGSAGCSPSSFVCRYDPKMDAWYDIARLNHPREGAIVLVVDGHLYVTSSGEGSHPSTERYDSQNNTWTVQQRMPFREATRNWLAVV
jgi:hypothetical protein